MAEACCQPHRAKPQVVFAGATVRAEACEFATQMVRRATCMLPFTEPVAC